MQEITTADKVGIDCPLAWQRRFIEFVAQFEAAAFVPVDRSALAWWWRSILPPRSSAAHRTVGYDGASQDDGYVSSYRKAARVGVVERLDQRSQRRIEKLLRPYLQRDEVIAGHLLATPDPSGSSLNRVPAFPGEVVLVVSDHAIHMVRGRLLGSIPLVQLRAFEVASRRLSLRLEPDNSKLAFRLGRGVVEDSAALMIANQLASFQEVQLSLSTPSGDDVLAHYYPWRPGCPSMTSITGWSGPPSPEDVLAVTSACFAAIYEGRRPVRLGAHWAMDDGSGNHLRIRLQRIGLDEPIRVLPAVQMTSSQRGTTVWLAYFSEGFAWVSRAPLLQVDPFSILPWPDIETDLSRLSEAVERTTGKEVPMFTAGVRVGAPALNGWAPRNPEDFPAIRFVLDGVSDIDAEQFASYVRNRISK